MVKTIRINSKLDTRNGCLADPSTTNIKQHLPILYAHLVILTPSICIISFQINYRVPFNHHKFTLKPIVELRITFAKPILFDLILRISKRV